MTRDNYIKMLETVSSKPLLKSFVLTGNSILTKIIYLVYPALLIALVVNKDPGIWEAILVPGISFVILSLFRKKLDSPRPYEMFNYKPLINKESKGKSFPSRHIFSVFIIGITIFFHYPLLGFLVWIVGGFMAAMRVLGGVHFPKDVIAGMCIGIICGILGHITFCLI